MPSKLTIEQINDLPAGAFWLRQKGSWRLAEKYGDGWWLLMGMDCQIVAQEVADIATAAVRIDEPIITEPSQAEKKEKAFFKPGDKGGATPV